MQDDASIPTKNRASPMKMETVTSKTKKSINDNFNKIQLEIHPSNVSFLTTSKKTEMTV
jgi:hypothetical protein